MKPLQFVIFLVIACIGIVSALRMAGERLADKLAPYYFSTFAILVVASWLLKRYATFETLRRWHGHLAAGTVGIIGLFMLLMSADWPTFPFVVLTLVPFMSWMIWTGYRRTRFCLRCSETYGGFQPPAYCPKCGTATVGAS